MTRRLVVYAHFDAQNEVKRYVLHFLRALRELATRLVFASTSALPTDELDLVGTLCDDLLRRENVGFDFAMWRDALARTSLDSWDEVVLTNSSVFGPIFPLAPIFAHMQSAPVDAWGMTESREIDCHLQSYFLVLRRSALAAPALSTFWRGVVPLRDKDETIRRYEIGLSRALRDAGLSFAAYIPASALPRESRPGRSTNPTIVQPLALLQAGMPFVKVEVLRDNPRSVRLAAVRSAMDDAGYDPSLIEFDR